MIFLQWQRLKHWKIKMSLKIPHRMTPRKLKWTFGCGSGPGERIKRLRMTVTGLIRHERIESTFARCDETRGYAEKVCVFTKLATRIWINYKNRQILRIYWHNVLRKKRGDKFEDLWLWVYVLYVRLVWKIVSNHYFIFIIRKFK